MIGVKNSAIFLLVITLTDIIYSVNGRSVDQPVLLYVVPEAVNEDIIVPNVALVEGEKVAPVIIPISDSVPLSIPSEKDKVQVLHVMLDALQSVNENAMELVRTYVDVLNEDVEKINSRDVTPESMGRKKIPQIQLPQVQLPQVQLPQFQLQVPQITLVPLNTQTVLNPIHSAIAKYKAAINHLVKKFKAVPQHFIKKFKKTGLSDEPQNDDTQLVDPVKNPEEEKPADETMTEKPSDETMSEKPVEKPAEETVSEKPEDAEEPAPEARALDISNDEILSETVFDANTPEEVADKVKKVLEATRKMNEQSFELIEEYFNHIIDLSNKDRIVVKNPEDEMDLEERAAAASEVQEITVPLQPGCDIGFALIDGVCKEVYTPPVVPTNPLIAPINVLVQFIGSILEPIVPKNIAEDLANQVKIRAEAIVHEFDNN